MQMAAMAAILSHRIPAHDPAADGRIRVLRDDGAFARSAGTRALSCESLTVAWRHVVEPSTVRASWTIAEILRPGSVWAMSAPPRLVVWPQATLDWVHLQQSD